VASWFLVGSCPSLRPSGATIIRSARDGGVRTESGAATEETAGETLWGYGSRLADDRMDLLNLFAEITTPGNMTDRNAAELGGHFPRLAVADH
jgi:hypothetical protein